ncbi:MAG: endonuclease III domain-containing protein [Ectothiorhodospiraceae bacterium]|nr:endonuclease III domain-containing protein [Ectothiorhodospiraceae bacterium]
MLHAHYGPQHWWPGNSPFEMMVGAILTQNTAWTNVEYAIKNLKTNHCLTPQKILNVDIADLAMWLKPSGYFNVKAKRLRNFCQWLVNAGGFDAVSQVETNTLRKQLLSINGVGPETADDILLYAFDRPVFVIDAYTRRLFSRLQLLDANEGYEHLRHQFEKNLGANAPLFNEYHALIVIHSKQSCTKKPCCSNCCLTSVCPSRSL